MKIFFKYLFVMLSLLATTVGFTACTDKDDDLDSSIVGTWAYEEDDYYEEVTFKANGTMIIESEEYWNGEWDYWTERGTYEVDGDELWGYIDDEYFEVRIVSITSTRLVLEDDEDDRITYYRVSD